MELISRGILCDTPRNSRDQNLIEVAFKLKPCERTVTYLFTILQALSVINEELFNRQISQIMFFFVLDLWSNNAQTLYSSLNIQAFWQPRTALQYNILTYSWRYEKNCHRRTPQLIWTSLSLLNSGLFTKSTIFQDSFIPLKWGNKRHCRSGWTQALINFNNWATAPY